MHVGPIGTRESPQLAPRLSLCDIRMGKLSFIRRRTLLQMTILTILMQRQSKCLSQSFVQILNSLRHGPLLMSGNHLNTMLLRLWACRPISHASSLIQLLTFNFSTLLANLIGSQQTLIWVNLQLHSLKMSLCPMLAKQFKWLSKLVTKVTQVVQMKTQLSASNSIEKLWSALNASHLFCKTLILLLTLKSS